MNSERYVRVAWNTITYHIWLHIVKESHDLGDLRVDVNVTLNFEEKVEKT